MNRVFLTSGICCCLIWFCTPSSAQEYDNFNKKELRLIVLERDSVLKGVRSRKSERMESGYILSDTLQRISGRLDQVKKEVFTLEESLKKALTESEKIKKTIDELVHQLEQKRLEAAPYRSYISELKKSAAAK